MKVVREIIWYLNRRGLLDPGDLRELRAKGFIDYAEEAELADSHKRDDVDDATPDPEDALTARLERRRKSQRKPPALSPLAESISARLLSGWNGWEDSLQAFVQFAARAEPVGNLAEALNVIRRTSAGDLDALTLAMLARRAGLHEIWPALAFEAYRDGVVLPTDRGAAVVAYRAILCGAKPADLGSYAAVLRHPGFINLLSLVQAQRAIFASLGRIVANQPHDLDRALFNRAFDPVCYWALTFVVSGAVLAGRILPFRTHFPARPFPFRTVPECSAAWTCATAIDSRLATRLFVELDDPLALPGQPVCCPQSWDLGYYAPPPPQEPARHRRRPKA